MVKQIQTAGAFEQPEADNGHVQNYTVQVKYGVVKRDLGCLLRLYHSQDGILVSHSAVKYVYPFHP